MGENKVSGAMLMALEEWAWHYAEKHDLGVIAIKVGPFDDAKRDIIWGTFRMRDGRLKVIEWRHDAALDHPWVTVIRDPTEDEAT